MIYALRYIIIEITVHSNTINHAIMNANQCSFVTWQKCNHLGAKRVRGNIYSSIEDQVTNIIYWVEVNDIIIYDNQKYKKSIFYQYIQNPQYAVNGIFYENYYDLCSGDVIEDLTPLVIPTMKMKKIVMY